ncbi:MAG TPA: FtsX-like permease family protein, partial [Puia sp.]|nr:FtsX-like permease family protein [Puia sp.]
LAVCLLIMLYIFDELSYDKHQKDGDRIYRLAYTTSTGEQWSAQPAPVAFTLKGEMPEVEQVTRLLKVPDLDKILLQHEQGPNIKRFFETNGYYVDSTFFQLFTYDFTYGNAASALSRPNSIVLSESVAVKMFGNENPIGKSIKLQLPYGSGVYTVEAVFKENHKSHIPAHFFMSMRNSDIGSWVNTQQSWATNNIFHTYVKLRPGTDPRIFEKRMIAFMDRHEGPELKAAGYLKVPFMQRMSDIYLHSSIGNEIAPNGNIRYLYIMGSIAAFILIIACINFMTLSTARSETRAREVGVRKVIGAERASLIGQFLGESFLLCLIALAIAFVLTQLLLPLFNELTQKELQLYSNPGLVFWIAGLAIVTGLFAGLYPAFYLSSFQPAKVLKGKILNSWSATVLRKGLVVFQFTISVMLILGAIVIGRQLSYMKHQDLGFKKDQQLILPITSGEVAGNYTALRNELLKIPGIASVTSGSTYPGIRNINDIPCYSEGRTAAQFTDVSMIAIKDDYFQTLGLKLLYGREFTRDSQADSNNIILNETAIRDMGYNPATAVGKRVNWDWHGEKHYLTISGVVRNFNYESLQTSIKPLGFTVNGFFANSSNYTIVRLQTGDYAQALKAIEQTWNKVNPSAPFEYSFLDQDFQRNYEKEERTSHIVIDSTVIAILIACLGLFGLAAFAAERRTKEIGIRKVLGASVMNVTMLLSGEFIRLAGLAILIASPLAWYGMHLWLRNFAYPVGISWWMFAAAGGLAIAIALITVSFQSIKTAVSNPAKSLRTE